LGGIGFEVGLATPCHVSVVFDFVWAVAFLISRSVEFAYISRMPPFPAVFALWYT